MHAACQVQRLGRGELGDGFGALGHCVLGQLARQHEAHSGLDLAPGSSNIKSVRV